MGRTGGDTRLSKAEQVWRELFPPQIGDWIEFEAQYLGKHRKMIGLVREIMSSEKGYPIYTIRVSWMRPKYSYELTPKYFRLKGNSRIKKLDNLK